jgi:hypothetical protein
VVIAPGIKKGIKEGYSISATVPVMMTAKTNPASAPKCDVTLCGNTAEWKVDFFGKTEHYCDEHRPMIPTTLMKQIKQPS